MAKNEVKVAIIVDDKGAKSGIKSVQGEFDKLGKTAEQSVAGIGGKVSSAFTKSFGKGSIASTSISSLGSSVDGLASGALSGALPLAAAGAGVAIAKFAVNSAAKFTELGKQVEKFSVVSGTSTDAASRFIAVADDYGVSAETLAGSVGKLGKALGANIGALDKYGVAVAKTKDGSVDLTQSTFNVIDAYNHTTDPAKKAALGTAAFGKSYQELIPLIDVGSDKIKASFDKVDKAQVFSDAKVKEAKDYGVALDNLKDQFYDFQLTVGKQVIPVLTELTGTVSSIVGPLNDLGDAIPGASLGNFVKALQVAINPIKLVQVATGDLTDKYNKAFNTAALGVNIFAGLDKSVTSVAASFKSAKIEGDGLGTGILAVTAAAKAASAGHDGLGDSIMGVVRAQKLAADQAKVATDTYNEQQTALKDLQDAQHGTTDAALASQQADLDAATSIDTYNTSLKNSKLTVGEHKQAFLDVQTSIFGASETFGDYVVAQEKGAGRIVTATEETTVKNEAQITSLSQLQSTVAPGSELWNAIQQYIDHLNSIPKSVYTNIDTRLGNPTGAGAGAKYGPRAAGGPVVGGSTYLVGEQGPELFMPSSSGSIVPNNKMAMAGGGTTIVNNNYFTVDRSADQASVGRAIAESLKAYERSSGTAWRS